MAFVAEGVYPSRIAKALGTSPTLILRHLAYLEKEGKVKSFGKCPKFFEAIEADFSSPVRDYKNSGVKSPAFKNEIHLHDFKMKIPIRKHGYGMKNAKEVSINNWTKKYYKEDFPTKATLEITTKSAIIHFHGTTIPRSIGFNAAMVEFGTKGMVAIASMLGRNGYKLDLLNAKVISQHLAADTAEEIDKQIAQGTTFKLNLGRRAQAFTGPMAHQAAAWVDRSKGPLEIETNDSIYEQLLIEMPLRVARVERGFFEYDKRLNLYDKNIKKHLATLDDMRRAMRAIERGMRRR